MRITKKSLLLILIMILLLTTACGNSAERNGSSSPSVSSTGSDTESLGDKAPTTGYPPGTLKIWTYGMPEYMRIWFQNYIDREDTAVEDVTVEMVNFKDEAEVRQQVMLDLQADTLDNLPTAISTFPVNMSVLVENDILKDVTHYFEPRMDEFVEGTFDQASIDDKIFGLPYVLQPKMMFYNSKIFEEYGLDPAKLDTFEGYLELGRELKEKSDGKVQLSYVDPGSYTWRYWFRRGLMPQANARIWDDNGNVAFDTDPGTRKAFDYFDILMQEDLLLKSETFSPAWYESARNGEFATFYFESFMDSYLRANLADMDGMWRSTKAPMFEDVGTRGAQVIGIYCLINNPDDPYADLFADMLLDFHFNIEARNNWTNEMIEIGQPTEHPITKDLLNDSFWKEPSDYYGGQSYREMVTKSFENPSENLVVNQNDAEADSIITKELEAYVAGGQDINTTISNIGNTLRQNLGLS